MKHDSLLSNVVWGISAQLIRSLLSIALIPIIISNLGTLEYGIFSSILLLSYSQGFLNQTDLGYLSFLVKQTAQFSGKEALSHFENQTQGFVIIWVVIQTIITILVALFLPFVSRLFGIEATYFKDFRLATLLVLMVNFISSWGALYSTFLLSQQQNAIVKKIESIGYFLFSVSAILSVLYKKNLLSLIVAFALSQSLQSLWLAWVVRRAFGRLLRLHSMFSLGFLSNWPLWKPFFFGKLNGLAIRQTDTAIVLFLGGPQFIAFYEIATKIPSLLKVLMGRISESFLAFSGANKSTEGARLINTVLTRLLFFKGFISLYGACGVLFYGKTILEAWLGTNVEPQLVVGFKFASLIPLVHSFSSSPGALLLGRDHRANFITWVPTAISVLNIIASIPATYYWGYVGTIVCTVLQFFISSLVLLKPIHLDFGLNLKSLFGRLAISLVPIFIAQLAIKGVLQLSSNRCETILILILTNAGFAIAGFFYYKNELVELKKSMVTKSSY